MESSRERQKMKAVLGIEGTAHTFGAGITRGTEILANERRMFKPLEGGLVPREVAQHHIEHAEETVHAAIEKAGIKKEEIGLVAFSMGPGLGPCLRVSAVAARSIAGALKVPILGVNHCVAHVEIAKLSSGYNDPVIVYLSGGSTQILAFENARYRIFGETLDIPIGNCLDVFAREAKLGNPGGPVVEGLARKSDNLIELPYVVKGMDFSFSGILTSAMRKIGTERLEDLCYSLQEYTFAMLTEATERAIAHTGKKECLLTGGVAANSRLQGMMRTMCEDRGVGFTAVPKEYAGDNGAMIAYLGGLMQKAGVKQKSNQVNQRWRTDEVEIEWH